MSVRTLLLFPHWHRGPHTGSCLGRECAHTHGQDTHSHNGIDALAQNRVSITTTTHTHTHARTHTYTHTQRTEERGASADSSWSTRACGGTVSTAYFKNVLVRNRTLTVLRRSAGGDAGDTARSLAAVIPTRVFRLRVRGLFWAAHTREEGQLVRDAREEAAPGAAGGRRLEKRKQT